MELQWDFNSGNNTNGSQDIGLSIIPVASNKTPFNPWAEYQTKIAPISVWHSHFLNQGTVGIITGKVSGNLECIDVDQKNDPREQINDVFLRLIPDELFYRLI